MSLASESKGIGIASWGLRIVLAAAFLFMGAIPKLTGQAISIELFELLGQPWARLPVGVIELAAAVLLLVPKTALYGGALAAVSMLGAIASHLGPLGLAPELTNEQGVKEPMPAMFFMAIAFLLMGAAVAYLHRPTSGASAGPSPA